MAYITLEDLKIEIGWPADNVSDDDLFEGIIERLPAILEAETGFVFEAETETRYYHPVNDVDGRTLRLDRPLLTVTTLTNGDGTVVTAAEYILLPRNSSRYYEIRLKADGTAYWTWSTHSDDDTISVAGTWGYSATADGLIKQASLRLASWLYQMKDAGVFDVTLLSGYGPIKLPQGFPRDISRMLRRGHTRVRL